MYGYEFVEFGTLVQNIPTRILLKTPSMHTNFLIKYLYIERLLIQEDKDTCTLNTFGHYKIGWRKDRKHIATQLIFKNDKFWRQV